VTDAQLREYFSSVAQPSHISMPVDRETGRPRGFAFVEFLDGNHAQEAIRRFNAQPFQGRSLSVSEARAREDRPPGGAPRPFRSADPMAPPPPVSDRPARTFGPPARSQRGSAGRGRKKEERGPKGPIREKATGRVFSVDDDSGEASLDFDDFATSSPQSLEEPREESRDDDESV
jgi:RNA recognition motif-containing protein